MANLPENHDNVALSDRDADRLVTAALQFSQDGQLDLALSVAHRAVALFSHYDQGWMALGQIQRGCNRLADARDAYAQATTCNPHNVEAWIARGVIAYQMDNNDRALEFLQKAISILENQPKNSSDQQLYQALHALGIVRMRNKDWPNAIAHFSRALELNPTGLACGFDLAEAWILAGYCCDDQLLDDKYFLKHISIAIEFGLKAREAINAGQLAIAEPILEALIALAPEEVWPYSALASVHMLQMQPELAEPLLREAVRLQPSDTTIIHDYSVALARLYRYAEAETLMSRLIERGDRHSLTFCNRAVQRTSMGLIDLARDDLRRAREILAAGERGIGLNVAALSTDQQSRDHDLGILRTEASLLPYMEQTSAEDLRHTMMALGDHLPRDHQRRCQSPVYPERKLRVGLLSNTLRRHPVGWLTLAGIEQLDRAEFDVVCFGRYEPSDAVAQRYAARALEWHPIEGMNDIDAADFVSRQSIDILIDMGGYGDAGRVQIAAFKPAPVQMKWVGMQCSTTGLREIDWMITDRWETPAGFERFYSERLLRLPDGYVCYTPPDYAPAPSILPALATKHVTFGCFNNVTKLSDKTLLLWKNILSRVPNSRMVLRCPQFSQEPIVDIFMRRWVQLGIDPGRLTILGRTAHPDFIAGYRAIDIALDPVPYCGGLTTCEALYMGVPVVTLAGEFFAARHSVSHLSNVGLHDWVTDSADDYVERAVTAANNIQALATLRSGLRSQMLASPLCNAPRFGRNLGAALRQAWRSACADPASIILKNPNQHNAAAA
jgi:predicted O-linked N-acetylglucosamine transferase (SPINDLY family)